jgi:MFS family permease
LSPDSNGNSCSLLAIALCDSYTVLQIMGGRLSEKYGAKWVLAAGVALPSVFTWITPIAAESSAWFAVAARVCIGLSHATVMSTGFAVISAWLPDSEKSTAAVLLNVGLELGGMVALLFTGWACAQPELGWRSSFYINGFAPLLWLVPFVFLFYSRPDAHPRLSPYESRLISRGKQTYESTETGMRLVPAKLRWKPLLTSRAVWANCSAKGFGYFGYYVLTTKMPAILDELFQLPIEKNGQLCALSFVAVLMAKIMCIPMSNRLKESGIISLTNLRKCFQTTSMLLSAFSMLALTQVSDSLPLSICCILLAMFGTGLQCGGETPQLTDFAQDLSGKFLSIDFLFRFLSPKKHYPFN